MRLTGKHYGIILSGLATAFLHLSLYPVLGFDPIFLNGFGYLALLAAYFLPIPFFQERRRLVWWALVGYTALTIVLWVLLGDKNFVAGTSSAIGYYAKAAEVILLAFLWSDKP
ncbi:MAG: hypothetical protein L0287_05020 [Anaerolineae bacterium]|nr:hypothetical protein [Anaerolineae bacterium]MCI0608295.1 hypothetical protein [Anaerolineae bacterium]